MKDRSPVKIVPTLHLRGAHQTRGSKEIEEGSHPSFSFKESSPSQINIHGVPALRVEVGHAQAELRVGCESPVGCEEGERRRLERVLRREDDLAMVASALEVRALGALQYKVPL